MLDARSRKGKVAYRGFLFVCEFGQVGPLTRVGIAIYLWREGERIGMSGMGVSRIEFTRIVMNDYQV